MKTCIQRFAILTASLALLVLPGQAQTKSRTYTIVAGESSFWVFAEKAGLFSALAHDHEIGIKSFTGKVVVPEAGASGGSLELEVNAQSLVVLDKKPSEEDKKKIYDSMHSEVLESAKYSKITFKSVSIGNVKPAGAEMFSFTLTGDLTLHGVTKRIAVQVTAKITAQQLRASGKYTLKQTDFGIKPYSAAGGTVKVKNELVVNFDIVAKAS
jgi:polyisoprenoid-binding protein YceI